MLAVQEDIQYDRFGRMQYHPEFHPNHGKSYTESDLEYLCKFWEIDDWKTISMALGRPEHSIASKVYILKKDGKFEYYKKLNKYW